MLERSGIVKDNLLDKWGADLSSMWGHFWGHKAGVNANFAVNSREMPTLNLSDFSIDLRRVSERFWRLLGEAKSKCQHLDHAPLLPGFLQEMHLVSLVRGIQGTTAIEGNTLTVEEVRAIIERRSHLPPSMQYQEQEVQNVLRILDAEIAKPRSSSDLHQDRLCKWNGDLLKGLDVESHVKPGKYRTESVHVGRYLCPSPATIPDLMGHFFKWYGEMFRDVPEGFHRIEAAIIKAIVAHLYFVLIHPFGDGNGRTARMIEWFTLDCAGIPSSATHLLSDHYNLTRAVYVRKLDEASVGGDPMPFLIYALEGFVDKLGEQLKTIYRQYVALVFAETVRQTDLGKTHGTIERRRELAIAIAMRGKAVRWNEMPSLTPSLTEAYRGATLKTVSRDLSALEAAELVVFEAGGWVPQVSQLFWKQRRAPAKAVKSRSAA